MAFMICTQIQLTDEQARLLRELAAEEGRSVADVVRDGVNLLLRAHRRIDREALKRRSLEALGRFHSGVPDLGLAHDQHLDDAFGP
jgi:Arc/MetJ-type ribon-helix-helix transcriptional regulator